VAVPLLIIAAVAIWFIREAPLRRRCTVDRLVHRSRLSVLVLPTN
jgi:hypothetical protein